MVDIKIDIGKCELEKKMPNLKRVYFTRGAKEDIITLSKHNENILVCKNGKGYIGGILRYDKYDWVRDESYSYLWNL